MNTARRLRAVLVGVGAVACTLAGCSSAVSGHGADPDSRSGTATSSSPDFPATSPSAATSTPTTPTSAAGTAPTVSDRVAALSAKAGGDHVLVRVPGGYEAATYDQNGHIGFWHDPEASTTWRQVGSSSYPAASQLGPPSAKAIGALLRDMSHATFIVRGLFTTDSSGNAVAFTTGGRGWGAIKAESNGNIGSSGRAVGSNRIGLSYDFKFHDGLLQTKDCPQDRPIAECGAHPVVKNWRWAGRDFHPA